jgi:beta-lactamase class A
LNLWPQKKSSFARRQRRRRWFGFLAVLLVLVGGAVYVMGRTSGDTQTAQQKPSPVHRVLRMASGGSPEEPVPASATKTPEGAAYWKVAPEMPGVGPDSVEAVYRSKLDPSWASVRFKPEEESKPFFVFVQKTGDRWEAKKSLRADEPDNAKNDVVPLAEVPKDLVQYVYPENAFAADVPEPEQEKVDDLPSAGPANFAPPEPVSEGVPDSQRERVEKVLGQMKSRIEGYDGVAGVYVEDLEGNFGYGVRPDEEFFTASTIKLPVMVAVYRKVDAGELSFSQSVEIKDEDWAAGAGWLQWHRAGTKETVGDLLLLMMTQSDNVAANALVRTVGGADYVNEVARSLGAKDTLLYQKISSERAVIPQLDNRSTPRDMATMLQKIADGEAASEKSCGHMMDLMHQDELDWWLDAGLPEDVDAANKAGWLYEVYDDVGIVKAGNRHYVVAIMSKYGQSLDGGESLIKDLSKAVWDSQSSGGS